MKFQIDFGAEDEARLTPCEDDKPKDAEIALFKAGSDYSLSAIRITALLACAVRPSLVAKYSTSLATLLSASFV